ncbi:MAG: transporter associated domain-containing protein [Legionellaceae bacterium]|nr:transporter associated domain-containing protein [Legionellaceae bacterium]
MIKLTKEYDSMSWFMRIKQFLHVEPQTKEQLISLLRDAQIRALIDSETLSMLEGALAFAQLQVRDIMLPKKQMTCIDQNAKLEDIIHIVTYSGHSRFPVLTENKDEVIGILHAKDLLRFQDKENHTLDLSDIVRVAPIVPESKRLDTLLNDFKTNRNHMAIVVDEYGSISGFVTLEDIIEQIVGDIADEFDIDEEAYVKAHGDAHYIIKAHMPIEEFNDELQANFSDESYDTIGGIIMANFGYLPKSGEKIIIENFEFIIISADARRIHLIECFDQRSKIQNESQQILGY